MGKTKQCDSVEWVIRKISGEVTWAPNNEYNSEGIVIGNGVDGLRDETNPAMGSLLMSTMRRLMETKTRNGHSE